MKVDLSLVLTILACIVAFISLVYFSWQDYKKRQIIDDLRESLYMADAYGERWRLKYKWNCKKCKKKKSSQDINSLVSQELIDILMALSNDEVFINEYPTEKMIVEWLRRYELNLKPMTKEEMLDLDRKTNK